MSFDLVWLLFSVFIALIVGFALGYNWKRLELFDYLFGDNTGK